MKRPIRYILLAAYLILILTACGGLRYSQVDPEAKNFHPKRIGALPVDVGPYEEARGIVDQIVGGVLMEKGWFVNVVSGDDITRQFQVNEELRKVTTDYAAKFKAVNFSDPQLSARIGELCGVDAFLLVSVDYWNYTTIDTDKVAKVEMGIKMVEAATGKVLWKAGHSRAEKYLLLKPDLPDVAKALVKEMISEMPH
ncbi:MAG: hypothetical protein A4E72_00536 [Syntrophus sp. PtaU1.Bin208]|nr:MAG: hypothetical protein A4E72_00536 [Syntrophus sp. PtaU1.Bin208]